ncbi:unnamed protein product, partial [Iphiclides podalirius]
MHRQPLEACTKRTEIVAATRLNEMHRETAALLFAFAIMLASASALKYVDDDLLLFWRRSNSEPCEPFTSFRVLCNRCVCSADSTLYCTKMYCGKRDAEQNKISEEEFLEK